MAEYLDEIEGRTDAADPTVGDTEIANYTINFGPQHPCGARRAAHGDGIGRRDRSNASIRMSVCSTGAPKS